ncbi:ABC transporter permease [Diplocloster agilis]|uniref:ABC transporter permease n=1 Tax=Diplocloster agilis TaxID=2850323 RepID=A0A949K2Q7_9FIRM|nr:ABC transporter permease [Diplocloster agilis]MBU9735456.1 ABC transporter permease [Diplocloster agilis]
MNEKLRKIKAVVMKYPILVFLTAAVLVALFFTPNFFTVFNLKNLLLQSTDLLILSCGLTLVQLNAGIDFSITSVLSLGSVLGAYLMARTPLAANPLLGICAAVLMMAGTGVVFGIINGAAVTRLKMPSFIVTLVMQMIGSGAAVLFVNSIAAEATLSATIAGLPPAFGVLGGLGNWFFVPVLIAAAVFLFSDWLLTKTRFGRNVYAVGTNARTAEVSGIPVKKTIFLLFVLCGLYAGISSILATARNQSGIPTLGDKMFLNIIGAVIIGGTSVLGGSGGVRQTLLGVIFMSLMTNVMNLMNVTWYIILLVQGILIFVVAMMDYVMKRQSAYQEN